MLDSNKKPIIIGTGQEVQQHHVILEWPSSILPIVKEAIVKSSICLSTVKA